MCCGLGGFMWLHWLCHNYQVLLILGIIGMIIFCVGIFFLPRKICFALFVGTILLLAVSAAFAGQNGMLLTQYFINGCLLGVK